MKLLYTVQDLVLACSICPMCHNTTDLLLSLGPTFEYQHTATRFSHEFLTIVFRNDNPYDPNNVIEIDIDMQTNKFRLGSIYDATSFMGKHYDDGRHDASFYWFAQSDCPNCDWHIISSNIALNFADEMVYNLGIEREHFNLEIDGKIYHIYFDYMENKVFISLENKSCEVPMWNVNLLDIDKLKKRIKTLLVFG